MVGEPRQSVDNSDIVVDIDCTERPLSGAGCDFGVTVAVFDASCVLLVDVDGTDCPAALLSRLSNSFTKPNSNQRQSVNDEFLEKGRANAKKSSK